MHFLRYVSSMYKFYKTLSGKKKRLSTVSSSTGTTATTMSFDSSSTSSAQPLYVPPAMTPNHAEMMDDDNMAWGPPKPRRRERPLGT